ncbi:DUF4097 domain-containing protein [Amycolatopsis sp. NPDC059027]|uniref:DUF4097 family beta strand repeat-containing protein n=1 Tax=unclassified Amycolatopsis TaxID=2618356 RepID=UPI00366B8641
MPIFETPEPISVTLELGVGDVRFSASDRADTVVEVRPTNPADESDVKAAGQVRVEYANGRLQIKGPKARAFDFSRKTRSVTVSIELPTGSHVAGDAQVGGFRATGRLGECRLKTSVGDFQFEHTGSLHLDTSTGHVTADGVAGNADIHTSSGKVRIGEVEGSVVVKNSNGNTEFDAVAGEVRARAANGDIFVGRAGAGVDAKTANGGIRIGEVVRGSVMLATSMGDLEVGVADGTAAWLEVHTGFGQVHNLMESATRPDESDETVEVRARTSYGDITIRRS